MNRLSSGVQDDQKLKLMAVLAHPDDESLGFDWLLNRSRGPRGPEYF